MKRINVGQYVDFLAFVNNLSVKGNVYYNLAGGGGWTAGFLSLDSNIAVTVGVPVGGQPASFNTDFPAAINVGTPVNLGTTDLTI